MKVAFVVRGRLTASNHIELEEPVQDIEGPVEVTVRPLGHSKGEPLYERASATEWRTAFHAWIESHDRTVPIPPAESLRRERIYEDRV